MPKFIPLTGQIFGNLIVLDRAESVAGRTRWKCECACGNKTVVGAVHLKSGHTVSCGCARHLDYCSIDITGERFGRLVAKQHIRGGMGVAKTKWVCDCDCGNSVTVSTTCLRQGHTKSCGCFQAESRKTANITHGMTNTPTYLTWGSMIQRCTNRKKVKYPIYGGRGITVCDRWRSFENFFTDMGVKPENMTLDRINVDGDYTPENCRWATNEQQGNNKRYNKRITCNGTTKTLSQWVRITGISRWIISDRLAKGQSPEQAMGL